MDHEIVITVLFGCKRTLNETERRTLLKGKILIQKAASEWQQYRSTRHLIRRKPRAVYPPATMIVILGPSVIHRKHLFLYISRAPRIPSALPERLK